MDALELAVQRACADLAPGEVAAVACSGGRDSMALLHVTARLAAAAGFEVLALHVHHGLSTQADGWVAHLEVQSQTWRAQGWPLRLEVARLGLQHQRGLSLEAQARQARYAALTRMAQAAGVRRVLLAHHRDDQAETFLLQALRGAGAAGLSAMPEQAGRDGLLWLRPWLAQSRTQIEAYVQAHGLTYVDDDSNTDPRHARNRLRLQVMPALRQAFSDAPERLAGAARRAQDAAACLADLARLDLSAAERGPDLAVAALLALSPPRRRNLLKHWLQEVVRQPSPASLICRLADELAHAPSGRWTVPGGAELRVYRQRLMCGPPALPVDLAPQSFELDLRPGAHELPDWGGRLIVEPVSERGLDVSQSGAVSLRLRQGGEQFQLAPRSLPRQLKKQYQAAGVPQWLRAGPLVWRGEALIFAPGLGVDARCWATADRPQVGLRWEPGRAG